VTSAATVAGTSYWAWNSDAGPATYGLITPSGTTNQSLGFKGGSTTLAVDGTSGGNITYWFDAPSNWTNAAATLGDRGWVLRSDRIARADETESLAGDPHPQAPCLGRAEPAP
jgi:hypothetical protein